jgi:hypothetical protein
MRRSQRASRCVYLSPFSLLLPLTHPTEQVYVPSEWGTDWRGKNQELVQSPMFENKKKHLEEVEARGLKVLAVHNGLILEISFSDWLGIPARCVFSSFSCSLSLRERV